jgi:hypothetical protein
MTNWIISHDDKNIRVSVSAPSFILTAKEARHFGSQLLSVSWELDAGGGARDPEE